MVFSGRLFIFKLTALAAIFIASASYSEGASSSEGADDRIKHVIVLMMENRPYDHLFGWSGIGNGLSGDEYNLVNPSDATSEKIYVSNKAPLINECDPCHATPCTTQKLFSSNPARVSGDADMGGFVAYQNSSSEQNYCNVMNGFPPSKVPILNALAKEYAIMDRFFASHPGPTWPNRMFALSATSAGSTETSCWYHDLPGNLYPQKTIYDQVEQAGLTWKNYFNDTPWELILESVAHNPHNLHPLDQFYKDAESGDFPAFSWINPRSGMNVTTGVGSNDQHPDHDISAGEQYYKDIYEAIRSSPAWESTLFVITYDEHGGFYDHVVPPSENIPPPGDGERSYPEPGFKFDRLGVRIPTLLISPWIKKGSVISEPPAEAKPADNSEYELTSIIASARKLLGFAEKTGPLTDRDAWAATFDHALYEMEEPRDDCPMHLPEALQPELPNEGKEATMAEQDRPLNDLQEDVASVLYHLGGRGAAKEMQREKAMPQRQGELSEWLQQQYQNHECATKDWIESKLSRNASVVAKVRSDYRGKRQDNQWDLNGLPFGSTNPDDADSTSPYITLSTHQLTKPGTSDPFCLDGGTGEAGSVVKASLCYPSRDPDSNRDAMQHFVLHNDGTLRLYNPQGEDHLCVTNSVFADYYRRALREGEKAPEYSDALYSDKERGITLQECDDDVNQTFAYHGIAPGDNGKGNLEFGDVEFYLGVVMKL